MKGNSFLIEPVWEVYPDKAKEIGCTSANIEIFVNQMNATQNINRDSKTIRDHVYLSAYPLALWLARSWWRLLYENAVPKQNSPEYDVWRLAHDLTSAGEGFAWPDMEFISDGVNMQIINYMTAYNKASLDYLNPFNTSISLKDFEKAGCMFIEMVCERLREYSISDTELHECWHAILGEYRNPDLKQRRMWEARLGFDPEEASEETIRCLLDKVQQIGSGSLIEIVAGFNAPDSVPLMEKFTRLEQRLENGIKGSFDLPDMKQFLSAGTQKPWKIGYAMAKNLRKQCAVKEDGISSKALADMLGIREKDFFIQTETRDMSLACRTADGYMFAFQRGTERNRRFNAARILADNLQAADQDVWLAATNAGTHRQKIQRAFAGELLCPIDQLLDFIKNEVVTTDLIEEAAEHFKVSPFVPTLQLYNNGELPQDIATQFDISENTVRYRMAG